MNKKLLALAVAAALAPAAAMADNGNVNIYGVIDASIDVTDNGDTAAAQGTRTHKVSSNSSRLGFKGTEDLGNGLNAVWQVETALNVDGGSAATTLGSRNTFLGLSSKTAGTVLLGRHDTPYKLATRGLDYFTDGLADNRNLMGGGGTSYNTLGSARSTKTTYTAGVDGILGTADDVPTVTTTFGKDPSLNGAAASFDGRQSDVVAYISPKFSGFHAAVAYVAGAEGIAGTGTKGKAWSAMGMYDNGPLMASLAYEKHSFGTAGTGTLAPTIIDAGNNAVDISGRMEKAWKLGVGYKIMPALQVGFAFEKTTDDLDGGSNALGHKAWTLGGKYSLGSNDLKLAYTQAGDNSEADTGAKQWALGVDHNMSKRTKVYAQYVRLTNDTNASYGLTGAGATGSVAAKGVDADVSALSLGVRHSF